MEIEIRSINKTQFSGKILIEVIWKYKERHQVNYIITEEDYSEEQIINYLKNLTE